MLNTVLLAIFLLIFENCEQPTRTNDTIQTQAADSESAKVCTQNVDVIAWGYATCLGNQDLSDDDLKRYFDLEEKQRIVPQTDHSGYIRINANSVVHGTAQYPCKRGQGREPDRIAACNQEKESLAIIAKSACEDYLLDTIQTFCDTSDDKVWDTLKSCGVRPTQGCYQTNQKDDTFDVVKTLDAAQSPYCTPVDDR